MLNFPILFFAYFAVKPFDNLQIRHPQSKIPNMVDGILIIDKPVDWTSHDVVGKMRKILKTKRIGHTGTLDPFATGVLVILVGNATRLAQFLDKDVKGYEAVVKFGFETDTGDLTGLRRLECGLRIDEIEEILGKTNWDEIFASFRGEISQVPPMYSAKKVDGKKLYELARKGIEIDRKPVSVTIYELRLMEAILTPKSHIGIRTSCSAGTYIRTLAEDIGRKIGVGAHLFALRRTQAGKFGIGKAVTLEQLEQIVSENKLDEVLISMNDALKFLPEIKLSADEIRKTQNGVSVSYKSSEIKDNQVFRMIDENNNLIAIGFYNGEKNVIQPRIVLV